MLVIALSSFFLRQYHQHRVKNLDQSFLGNLPSIGVVAIRSFLFFLKVYFLNGKFALVDSPSKGQYGNCMLRSTSPTGKQGNINTNKSRTNDPCQRPWQVLNFAPEGNVFNYFASRKKERVYILSVFFISPASSKRNCDASGFFFLPSFQLPARCAILENLNLILSSKE